MDVHQHSDSESGASEFDRECHSFVLNRYRLEARCYFADFLITNGGDGTNQGMIEQLLDADMLDRGRLPEPWAPFGLRYHGIHDLLPALPYHQMSKAHQRLLAGLQIDSPYH